MSESQNKKEKRTKKQIEEQIAKANKKREDKIIRNRWVVGTIIGLLALSATWVGINYTRLNYNSAMIREAPKLNFIGNDRIVYINPNDVEFQFGIANKGLKTATNIKIVSKTVKRMPDGNYFKLPDNVLKNLDSIYLDPSMEARYGHHIVFPSESDPLEYNMYRFKIVINAKDQDGISQLPELRYYFRCVVDKSSNILDKVQLSSEERIAIDQVIPF